VTGAGGQRCLVPGCRVPGCWVCRCAGAAVLVLALFSTNVSAQGGPGDRVVAAVRSAMAPALPFPETDAAGAVPRNGNANALWMVRPPEPGEATFEIIANPLNEVNQVRATRAMAQIENNIAAAQRRADAQYDRALAEAKRTGKSQEVDGVTLGDEGIAGAKIDAESHVLVEVAFDQPSYTFDVTSSVRPAPSTQVSIAGSAGVIAVPSNTYRDARAGVDRYAEAETLVFLGRLATPEVQERGDHAFAVTAAATSSDGATLRTVVVRLRGNEVLIADLLRKTNWNSLLELLK
jgi:hypothetical protein